MKHFMPSLPYPQNALAPKMSEETIAYHYGKHVQAYLDNLNRLLPGTEYEQMCLQEIICKSSGAIYNNAAQVWNHQFFFESLTPSAQPMSDLIKDKLIEAFGSVENFKEQFLKAAAGHFGSGWAWLSIDEKCKLVITTEPNAGCPLRTGLTPLLTIDVWEHAYYIDYRNRRTEYLESVWSLIDWNRILERYENTTCNIYI